METIKIKARDWIYNAGIIGLANILHHSGDIDEGQIKKDHIEIAISSLDNFKEKYYNYFIDNYKETMWFYNFKNIILKAINQIKNEQEINKKHLKTIKNTLKNESYKRLIEIDKKALKDITVELLEDLLGQLELNEREFLITEITGSYNQRKKEDSKHGILNKHLNVDVMKLDTLQGLIEKHTKKEGKYVCISCYGRTSSASDQKRLSLLRLFSFDTNRKKSHAWNFEPYTHVCPICYLVFHCIPAGFTTIYGKGFFINHADLYKTFTLNNNIRKEVLNNKNNKITYKEIMNNIKEKDAVKTEYQLADIEVVENWNNRYTINFLSRKVLRSLQEVEKYTNNLINTSYKDGDGSNEERIYLYNQVMDMVINNKNLINLVHKLIVLKLSDPEKCYFSLGRIRDILIINATMLRGRGYMVTIENINESIRQASNSGYYLRKAYIDKGAEHKLAGIAHRFLNALKSNNRDIFMDTLLSCYLYAQKEVPKVFLEVLQDEEAFKTIGYAFVSNLIYEEKNKEGKEE